MFEILKIVFNNVFNPFQTHYISEEQNKQIKLNISDEVKPFIRSLKSHNEIILNLFEHCHKKIDISVPKNELRSGHPFNWKIDYSKTDEPIFTGKFGFKHEYSIGTYYDYEMEIVPSAVYKIYSEDDKLLEKSFVINENGTIDFLTKSHITVDHYLSEKGHITDDENEIKYYRSITPSRSEFVPKKLFENAVLDALVKGGHSDLVNLINVYKNEQTLETEEKIMKNLQKI